MAATRRAPRRPIHHSDRGAAYTSLAFSQRITELELHQSLGKTGDCYDWMAVAPWRRSVGAGQVAINVHSGWRGGR
jgi:hypothetical protein